MSYPEHFKKLRKFHSGLNTCGYIPIVSSLTVPVNIFYWLGLEIISPIMIAAYRRKAGESDPSTRTQYQGRAMMLNDIQREGRHLLVKGIFFNPVPIIGNLANLGYNFIVKFGYYT